MNLEGFSGNLGNDKLCLEIILKLDIKAFRFEGETLCGVEDYLLRIDFKRGARKIHNLCGGVALCSLNDGNVNLNRVKACSVIEIKIEGGVAALLYYETAA